MPSPGQRTLFAEVEPHGGVTLAILGPILGNANLKEKMNAAMEQSFHLAACRRADTLDLMPAATKHERLLTVARDMDDLVDAHAVVRAFLPFFRLDRRRIRQLLMKLNEDLFARNF